MKRKTMALSLTACSGSNSDAQNKSNISAESNKSETITIKALNGNKEMTDIDSG